jgi:hypothetical protein
MEIERGKMMVAADKESLECALEQEQRLGQRQTLLRRLWRLDRSVQGGNKENAEPRRDGDQPDRRQVSGL